MSVICIIYIIICWKGTANIYNHVSGAGDNSAALTYIQRKDVRL